MKGCIQILIIAASTLLPSYAFGMFELSGTFSFTQSSFGGGSYQWTRRLGTSLGYYFFSFSEIEVSVQDVLYRTNIAGVQDTTFHDMIYSLDWVQYFFRRNAAIQPYVKVGAGQLNRESTGTFADGARPPTIYDSLTIVLGFGMRISVFRAFGLRIEGVSYLTGGVLSSWRDNFAIQGGASIYF